MNQNKNIHALARAVIIDQDHLLLAHHPKWKQGHYYLPGGHIEHGESATASLIRELDEEMGLAFTVERFLGCLEYSFKPNLGVKVCHTHEYNFFFLAHCKKINARELPMQKEENVAFAWVPIKNLATINVLPAPLIQLIPAWIKQDCTSAFKSDMI